ncbi:MAG TPA: 16S rRNA (cytidine(1402)-2'-O)-methyltransferase [Anaerolineaceae bacterium]|nr:16S rRNA (cytidine(1402)-2'-O)-methyltransferase [Anaerolineaceae bacterium]
MTAKPAAGKLYVVATPIGNSADITRRAVELLSNVDAVVCEERKNGARLLKELGLEKPLIELNEHNESSLIQEVLVLLMQGQSLALISDCGTPVFSDPGRQLLILLDEMKVQVVPIPGASSLIAAMSVCPFNLEQFQFAGFLPPKTEQRQSALTRLSRADQPIILMDTPYRLGKLLLEVQQAFGKKQRVFLACNLTLPGEKLYNGTVEEIIRQANNRKAEFILILDRPQRKQFGGP